MKYNVTVDFTIRNIEVEVEDGVPINRLQDAIFAAIPDNKKPKQFNSMTYQVNSDEYTVMAEK
jgi:helix-turn-helix protein